MSKETFTIDWEMMVPSYDSEDKEQKSDWRYILVMALTGLSDRLD